TYRLAVAALPRRVALLERGQTHVARGAQLVLKAQGLRSEYAVLGEQSDQVLLTAHDKRCDACAFRLLHGAGQQTIRSKRLAGGGEEVPAAKVHGIDLGGIDEAAQVDLTRFLGRSAF